MSRAAGDDGPTAEPRAAKKAKSARVGCPHLARCTAAELEGLQARFGAVRGSAAAGGAADRPRREAGAPQGECGPSGCGTCGLARLGRGDALIACLHCDYVGCWSPRWLQGAASVRARGRHIQLHLAASSAHWLAAHVDRLELYCALCADFVYDDRFCRGVKGADAKGEPDRLCDGGAVAVEDGDAEASAEAAAAARRAAERRRPAETFSDESTGGWLSRCRAAGVPALRTLAAAPARADLARHGLRGLVNMGNTCFMSCILQALLHNPALQAFFLFRGHERPRCASTAKLSDKDAGPVLFTAAARAPSPGPRAPSPGSGPAAGSAEGVGDDSHGCLACEVADMFGAMFRESGPDSAATSLEPHAPHRMLYATWRFEESLAGYEQHDAHEFLMTLLHGLASHVSDALADAPATQPAAPLIVPTSVVPLALPTSVTLPSILPPVVPASVVPSSEGADTPSPLTCSSDGPDAAAAADASAAARGSPEGSASPAARPTFVHEVFCGALRSDVVCARCGSTSSTREPFLDLSLALGDVHHHVSAAARRKGARPPSHAASAALRLEDCLARFTCAETLGGLSTCAACGESVERRKQLRIDKLPNVLVLHLKRFDARQERKIRCAVDFPLIDLDLAPFLAPKRNDDVPEDAPPHLYRLSAVINHDGDLGQGHYTAFVSEGGSWFFCDDHHVHAVREEDVRNSEGYILLYVRSDVARTEPLPSS